MSKFKVGDLVKVVDDLTTGSTGKHLIGLVGTITEVGDNGPLRSWAGSDYRYAVETGDHRFILANASELELVRAAKTEPTLVETPTEIPIGRLVVVDKDCKGSWSGTQGIVMSGLNRYGSQQVKITKPGPHLIGTGASGTYRLSNLTDITDNDSRQKYVEEKLSDISGTTVTSDRAYIFSKPPVEGAKKDVSHYTQGMPEGLQPMDLIRSQGWAREFALGNALKYILRAQYKGTELLDLKKAQDYLAEAIKATEEQK